MSVAQDRKPRANMMRGVRLDPARTADACILPPGLAVPGAFISQEIIGNHPAHGLHQAMAGSVFTSPDR